ncbi:hypothetical protein EJB05_48199, partial [Eragrostis curvula]
MNPQQPPGSSSHATHNSDDVAANAAAHGDGGNATTLRDRILQGPDAHIGSVSKRTRKLWVHDECGYMAQAQREPVAAYVVPGLMAQREVTYVPALLKIFDEVLLHAADNHHPAIDATLRVDVDAAGGRVSVYCTGDGGVPIAVHHDKPVFVPETLFGHFTGAGDNPDDNNIEVAGAGDGRYGVKLANVFSTEFIVEIADGPGRRKYKQVFSDNMGTASYPEVTGYTEGTSFTKVTFTPDLARFNMTRLDEDDAVAAMQKRTFDMTGVLGGAVQVEFNGKRMPVQCFSDYVLWHVWKPWSMANGSGGEPPVICKSVDGQWEVGVSLTGHGAQFAQVSFVNKIATVAGGTHVDHVARKIATHVVSYMKDRFGQADVDEEDVKRHLMVFVNLLMESPTFDSPTSREALTTSQEEFGSECELSHLFYAMVLRRLLARLKTK